MTDKHWLTSLSPKLQYQLADSQRCVTGCSCTERHGSPPGRHPNLLPAKYLTHLRTNCANGKHRTETVVSTIQQRKSVEDTPRASSSERVAKALARTWQQPTLTQPLPCFDFRPDTLKRKICSIMQACKVGLQKLEQLWVFNFTRRNNCCQNDASVQDSGT